MTGAGRWWGVALVGVGACGDGPPAPVGNDQVSKITIAVRDQVRYGEPGYRLDVSFDVRRPPHYDQRVLVRAACQVGSQRYVATADGSGAYRARRMTASPFSDAQLLGKPSMCDVDVELDDGGTRRELIALCARGGGRQTAGRCPVNPPAGTPVAGLAVSDFTLVPNDANVKARFDVQAHGDIELGTLVGVEATCSDGVRDHALMTVAALHAGESMRGDEALFVDGLPPPEAACDIGVYADTVSSVRDLVAAYCWRGRVLTPGGCQ